MNAPHTPDQPANQLRLIPLAMLDASGTNPRKRFDEAALTELSNSIKVQGILQPLLVREITWPVAAKKPAASWPFPTPPITIKGKPSDASPGEPSGRYEIIAGERRFRAAKLAGLADAPCFVRQLTDVQVLHAQVIENLQRDDLHPIEEAEGYERLMKEQDAEGKLFNADTIAAEIGKSRAYIYARLKLLALCHEARESFFKGELDASTALLIARIPVHKLQLQALKKITEKVTYNNPNSREGDIAMSYRAARDYIQDTFMLDLDKAPFDTKDATLIAKCSACTECVKRTGNQPELFDDVKSKDVCTDTVCFGMKKAAHVLSIQKAAEEKGDKVITGKEAKKILPDKWQKPEYQLRDAGLAVLDAKIPDDEKGRTWSQVLKEHKLLQPAKDTGKRAVQQTLIEDPHKGGMIETINIEDAIKHLREAGFEIKPVHVAKDTRNAANAAHEKVVAKQKLEVEQSNAYRIRLFNTLRQQIEADITGPKAYVAPGIYRILAENFFDGLEVDYNDSERLVRLYLPNVPAEMEGDELFDEMKKHLPTMTTQQHFLLMVDSIMIGESEASRWNYTDAPTTMLAIAEALGIDAAAIEKEAIAEAKAAQKAAEKAAKESAKASSTPTQAAPAAAKAPKKKAAQAPEVNA